METNAIDLHLCSVVADLTDPTILEKITKMAVFLRAPALQGLRSDNFILPRHVVRICGRDGVLSAATAKNPHHGEVEVTRKISTPAKTAAAWERLTDELFVLHWPLSLSLYPLVIAEWRPEA